MQKALDLPFISDSQAVERKIGIDGTDYLLRLLEVPIDDVDIDDDETVSWPETIEDKLMPQIDGAVTLYDVQDRATLEDVPKMLSTYYLHRRRALHHFSRCQMNGTDADMPF